MDNILKILEEKYTLITKKEIKFELSSNLITDLGMTSIIFVYFMLLIEEEFNINLEEVSYKQFFTVLDLINYIEKKPTL